MKTWIAQYITSALLGSWKTTIVGFLAAFTVLADTDRAAMVAGLLRGASWSCVQGLQ